MADRVERLWYGEGLVPRAARMLLWPASAAFGGIVLARNSLYDRGVLRAHTPRIPAISVGNLTVGGTGKTPVSSWIATQLQERGAHPAIVLRGYGEDEPLVHARLTPSIPVIVSANRLRGIERAVAQRADVVVLDDGFQHRQVARAADVVLVAADAPVMHARLLPGGPYREPSASLRRASLVIVTRKAASMETARRVAARAAIDAPGVPVAIVHLALTAVHNADGSAEPLSTLRGRNVLAIAGVGNARAFEAQLRQAGATVRLHAFRDHHPFTSREAESLARSLRSTEMALCTLKDAVKLLPLWPREATAIGYVSQAVIVQENGAAIDAALALVIRARLRQQ